MENHTHLRFCSFGYDTAEASVLMKDDKIDVRRVRTAKRDSEVEKKCLRCGSNVFSTAASFDAQEYEEQLLYINASCSLNLIMHVVVHF
jgi:hypothetical protein